VPADSGAAVVKFTISIPRESCTNAKAKYSSSVVSPDPSVHFYHWVLIVFSVHWHTHGFENWKIRESRSANPQYVPGQSLRWELGEAKRPAKWIFDRDMR